MKNFDVTFELNMDASSLKSYRVRANTAKKAVLFAQKKAEKDASFVSLVSCEECADSTRKAFREEL